MKIGKAQVGFVGNRKKHFKLKDGEQIYRILPPLGDLADSGRWSVFHNVHFGYRTTDGKLKPFLSPEVKNRTTKMVEVQDAAKDRIESLKSKLEEAKKSGNKAVFEKLNSIVGYPDGTYNMDSNHYMNVIDASGNIGILKLRHKAKLALESEIKKLNANGVDPLSPDDGRYFVFSRSGMGRDTVFSVNVHKEKLTVKDFGVVERDVVHKLDDDLLRRLDTEAGQLDKLFKKVTSEDVKKIVETSNLDTGISLYMDELFKKSGKDEEDGSEAGEAPSPTVAVSAPIASVSTPVSVVANVQSKAIPVVKPVPVVAKTTQSFDDLSSAEFLERLNNGTL